MAGGPLSIFEIAAVLVGLSALFGYLNHRYLKAPPTIGLVLIGLGVGTMLLLAETVLPAAEVDAAVVGVLVRIDFHELLMHGMLSFLLFAGALHVDIPALRCRWRTVSAMATVGTVLSTALVAGGIWLVASLAGHPLPFVWALVFGALISPTDPVAVLGLFESVRVPPTLKAALEGESLFNDGVGVVVFTVLLGVALQDTDPGLWHVGELFLVEVVGGAALGIALGYAGYRGVLGVEEPNLELLVTLGIVMVGYAAAVRFGVSGPIAMVVAGLFFGGQGMRRAVSPASRDYLRKFWSLLDNVLNSVLFLLIGLEVLVVAGAGLGFWWASLAAIPVVLATRWLSVALARTVLHRWEAFREGRSNGADLGRPARRHRRGPGAFATGQRAPPVHPRSHIRGGGVLHRWARVDRCARDEMVRVRVASSLSDLAMDGFRREGRMPSLAPSGALPSRTSRSTHLTVRREGRMPSLRRPALHMR